MSLYEIFSMFAALPKDRDPGMTKDEVASQLDRWRKLGLSDVKV